MLSDILSPLRAQSGSAWASWLVGSADTGKLGGHHGAMVREPLLPEGVPGHSLWFGHSASLISLGACISPWGDGITCPFIR